MITLAVAFLGALVAAIGTGMLAARAIRAPRGDLIAWTLALLGLAIGLAALTVGALAGFGPTTFRAMELGSQALAPLALCFGLTELAGRTVTVRFTGRLLLSALAVISFAVLATDALTSVDTFSKAWPDATVHYETISNKLLQFGLAPAVTLVGLISLWLAARRPHRDRAWRRAAPVICAGGLAALALAVPGLVALLGASFRLSLPLHGAQFAFLCLVSAALTLYGGLRAGYLRLGELHRETGDSDDDEWQEGGSWYARRGGDAGLDPPAGRQEPYRDAGLAGYRDPARGGYQDQGQRGHQQREPYRDDPGPGRHPDDQYGPGRLSPASLPAGPDADAGDPREQMFGQIAIYTLLEDRAGDFDRLTARVVAQVQAMEPDTLVYIAHAVPSAPLQRILYEVYRDRAAYDQHRGQPYVTRFEHDRNACVLATNVIELGLQQAKVSPFPSISELLDQTGISSPDFSGPVPGRDRPVPGRDRPQPGAGPAGYDPARYGQPGYGAAAQEQQ